MRFQGAIALLAGTISIGACSGSPSEPCPTDEALITHFEMHRAELAQLVSNPGDEEALSAAGVLRVVREPDGRTRLWMWHLDFPGPGGVLKGYLYGEPPPPTLVDSIDAHSDPGSPEEKQLYRRLGDNWYLFYTSSN